MPSPAIDSERLNYDRYAHALCESKGIRLTGMEPQYDYQGYVLRFTDEFGVCDFSCRLDCERISSSQDKRVLIEEIVNYAAAYINDWLDEQAEGN